jgi:hypothetical protein
MTRTARARTGLLALAVLVTGAPAALLTPAIRR